LSRSNFISHATEKDHNDYDVPVVSLTEAGWGWIDENLDRLVQGKPKKRLSLGGGTFGAPGKSDTDDEIPF
jgi:hypothetical protein